MVIVQGFETDTGRVFVSLWNQADGFPGDQGSLRAAQSAVVDRRARVEFADVPYGEYAVSLFHDANDNGGLDTGFMGIPKEPIGTSNDAKGRFGPPRYEDARFRLDQDTMTLTINLQSL